MVGDLNTRVGKLSPTINDKQLPRTSVDNFVCPRAPWLLELCTSFDLHILNGLDTRNIAPFTCHKHAGNSTIDYILSTDHSIKVEYDNEALQNLTDHTLLYAHIPMTSDWTTHYNASHATHVPAKYSWISGTSVSNYGSSASTWKEHTNTSEFLGKL